MQKGGEDNLFSKLCTWANGDLATRAKSAGQIDGDKWDACNDWTKAASLGPGPAPGPGPGPGPAPAPGPSTMGCAPKTGPNCGKPCSATNITNCAYTDCWGTKPTPQECQQGETPDKTY